MMKFAESVSVGTPSPTPNRKETKAEMHQVARASGHHSPQRRGSPQFRISTGARSPQVKLDRIAMSLNNNPKT